MRALFPIPLMSALVLLGVGCFEGEIREGGGAASPRAPVSIARPPSTSSLPPTASTPPPSTPPLGAPSTPSGDGWWRPAVGVTWQWQLTGTLDLSQVASVYDVDLFDTKADTVTQMHTRGARAVCYISVGSWEDWRPDKDSFPKAVIGNAYVGWPGEHWLDIRQIDQLAPVMRARLDLCKQKGFDGIEPDNIDAYTNSNTGFPLTADDQLAYNRWLANEAHARGLSIGLKNDGQQIGALEPQFDWAIIESCFAQKDWCPDFSPFVASGKPVFMAEYQEEKVDWTGACQQAGTLRFSAILKKLALDAWLQRCP